MQRLWCSVSAVALAFLTTTSLAHAQVKVVNMIPNWRSGETNQDSEPNIAVNPANARQIAASAFTPDPMGGAFAPIYISLDGGDSWNLNSVVPGAGMFGTGDITLRFGGSSNVLYAGILRGDSYLRLNILRTPDFTASTPMTILVDRSNVDQPYIQATTVTQGAGAGADRVYVGLNDFAAVNHKTTTIDRSLDAAKSPPPAGFSSIRLEARDTGFQDGPQCRPAIHPDGTVYAAFYGWRGGSGTFPVIHSDIVVVRDDNWAAGASPFTALKDSGDGLAGARVAQNVSFTWGATLGQERLSGDLTVAVDPRSSSTLYLGWTDVQPTTGYTIHVRRSTDRGVTWSADLFTLGNAKNPALAINRAGKIGLLYQAVTGTGASQRWETHIGRTMDGATWDDLVLATVPATEPTPTFLPYIGDYVHLMAVGQDFYGVFSANNTPDKANFPNGVVYQRNVDFGSKKLLALDNKTEVPISIDPFFFVIHEKVGPHYAFAGCDGEFHLTGDTGTGLYFSHHRHHRRFVNLEYKKADKEYWYYREKHPSQYEWAFARKSYDSGRFAVWIRPHAKNKAEWFFYEHACRIRPVSMESPVRTASAPRVRVTESKVQNAIEPHGR